MIVAHVSCTRSYFSTWLPTGFTVKEEKTEGPTTRITLLDIELDSELMELRLPQDKLSKLRVLVHTSQGRPPGTDCTPGTLVKSSK